VASRTAHPALQATRCLLHLQANGCWWCARDIATGRRRAEQTGEAHQVQGAAQRLIAELGRQALGNVAGPLNAQADDSQPSNATLL
jgi:hypothetical protein